MTTPIERIEAVLQASEQGLTIHSITKEAQVTEDEAKAAIKQLFRQGQIELIPTPGRWGPRYAWLAAKPVVPLARVERTAAPAPIPAPTPQVAVPDAAPARVMEPVEPIAEQPRFVVAVPKRKPRILRSAERAQAAALAAVRRGAPHAQVYELVPIGAARRGAEWRAEA